MTLSPKYAIFLVLVAEAFAVFCLLSAAALAAEPAPRPLPPEEAAAAMSVPPGFRTQVFAAEPDVVQPVSFCIDGRGRLLVAEALNYGEWRPTGKDRIIILEDTDLDGRADSRKVFYEGLNYVTGIEVGFGGVWAMSPPSLYFIPDRDEDDKPDGEPQVVFDGFGHKESRHNLANGFTWGPDGWLYAGHGRTSPSDVGRPGTPLQRRIHCDGGVYRVHPTRLVFENFADGNTNPWGVDFDDFGQCFVSNCVDPHLFHMIQGGHYEPWRGRPSSLYAYARLPTVADHLHYPGGKPQEMRGETAETLSMGGGHAHCGTLVYLGDQFPAEYRNTALMCNIHGRRINNDILRRKGSGYTASHGKDLMVAGDPWFMGVTLKTGPDGSVFVSDWSDTGECHTYKPNTGSGRIYKISHGDRTAKRVNLAAMSDEELVRLTLHRNDWFVRGARRVLQERVAKGTLDRGAVHDALRETLNSGERSSPERLRALWALHVTGGIDAGGLLRLLDDRQEHVRAWSIQLLCEHDPPEEAVEKLAALATDPSPVVRLYLAAALQRLPLAERLPIAAGLASHAEDAADANLPLMVWYGIEPVVPVDPAEALEFAVAAKIPLVRSFTARRVVEYAITLGEKGDLAPFVEALGQAHEAPQLDLLKGAREALRGKKSMKMPAGWPAVYARISRGEVDDARREAVVLALIFGDPQALADLRRTAAATESSVAERLAALESLIEYQAPNLAPLLHGLLADKRLRRTALRGLGAAGHVATPAVILGRYREFDADERADAVAALASRKGYALALLDAVESGIVPSPDVSAYVARQLVAFGDERITARVRDVWGEVRETAADKQEKIAKLKSVLTPSFLRRADLARGRLLYEKTCQQCHPLFGEGTRIGPDLTGTNRSNLDYLLSNIVDPSAEIGRDYKLTVINTTDGRVISGLVTEQLKTRLTIQTATEKIILPSEDIDVQKTSPQSMMPEGQLDMLSKEQIRDLIAYLGSKTQVPLPAVPANGRR